MSMAGPLMHLYREAAAGRFPPSDGAVTLLPAPPGPARAAIFATTAHHVVAADVSRSWLMASLDGSLAAPMSPAFVVALEGKLGLHADSIDLVLSAHGVGGRSGLVEVKEGTHARVRRALRSRIDVTVYGGRGAMVILGRGAAERREIAVEVDATARGRGAARAVLADALHLVEPDEPVFAQIAPGNAAALRACLAAGFTPIGGEVLFFSDVVGD